MDPLNWSRLPAVRRLRSRSRSSAGCAIGDLGLAESRRRVHQAHRAPMPATQRRGTDIFEKQFIVGWMEFGKADVVGWRRRQRRRLLPQADYRHAHAGVDQAARAVLELLARRPSSIRGIASTSRSRATCPSRPTSANWGLGDHLTLPDDWGKWAAVVARSTTTTTTVADAMTQLGHPRRLAADRGSHDHGPARQPVPGRPESSRRSTRTSTRSTTAPARGPQGGFSTVFGNLSTANATIGPFDPIFPQATMLSDGKVDAGDAPMPAAQIDVTIKDNNAADRPTSAASGYLFPSYKTEVYSRDGLGSDPRRQPRTRSRRTTSSRRSTPSTSRRRPVRPSPASSTATRRRAASTARAIPTGSAASSYQRPVPQLGASPGRAAATRDADSKCLFSQDVRGHRPVNLPAAAVRATTPSRSTPTRAARPT